MAWSNIKKETKIIRNFEKGKINWVKRAHEIINFIKN